LHIPVLLEEVLAFLDLKPGQVVVDATVGSGGHAKEILRRIGPQGRLIAVDQDKEAISRAQKELEGAPNAIFHNRNFSELNEVLRASGVSRVDAVLLDLGVSSEQLDEAHRGFSFHSLEGRSSILEVITIRNGYAESGGGISCSRSSPKILNCILAQSVSEDDGGGMLIYKSKPLLEGCTFTENTASHRGGGAYIQYSNVSLNKCVFSDNLAELGGGAMITESTITASSCAYLRNRADYEGGGGLYIHYESSSGHIS